MGRFGVERMGRPDLEFHPDAIEEARAACEWYEARNPAAADDFFVELEAALERILDAPDRYESYLHGTRRCILHRFPYLVVYRQNASAVQVVAVAHGRRRPGYWQDRVG